MNNFDFILIGILALFILFGAWRGLIRELISIATWVVACVTAWMFADSLADFFHAVTEDALARRMIAFVIIFIVVFILGMVLSIFAHRLIPAKGGVKLANRILGGLIGTVRGVAVLIVLFLVAGLTNLPQRPWWHASMATPYFEHAAVYVAGYIPRDIARHIRYS